MQVEAAIDVPFLAMLLEDLALLNVREFEKNPSLLAECLLRLLQRTFKWIRERPDNWRDARSLATSSPLCDCEDVAALVGAICSLLYENVFVGIKRVSETLCHAIVRVGNKVVDFCPLLGMPKGDGAAKPTVWKKLPDNRNLVVKTDEGDRKVLDVGAELVGMFLKKKLAAVKQDIDAAVKEASEDDNTTVDTGNDAAEVEDTGASLADSLAGYLIPGSLVSKVTALEAELKAVKGKFTARGKENATLVKEKQAVTKQLVDVRAAHVSELATLKKKHADLVSTMKKECDGAKSKLAQSVSAQSSRAAAVEKNVTETTARNIELEKALAAARALETAQKAQLTELEKRSNDSNRERIQELRAQVEAPTYVSDLARAFVEDEGGIYDAWYAVEAAGYVLANEKIPCCDDCAAGRPCAGDTCGHARDHAEHTDTGNASEDRVSDLDELNTGSVYIPRYAAGKKCDTGCPL